MATTPEEVEGLQRLRYEVYVEELGRYRAAADHGRRLLVEPEDAGSWLFYGRDGGEVVASTRITWGGAGFSSRQVDQYELQPWLEELPAELLAVGERTTVRASHRGTRAVDEVLAASAPVGTEHGVQVVFGCCEPHLVALYISMGQRPYARRNINSDEAGYLIPLVGFPLGADALRGRSHHRGPTALPECVERVLTGDTAVLSSLLLDPADYWHQVRGILDQLHAQRVSAFDGFADDEAARCLQRSNLIECMAGDRVLRQGGTARNIFVVLAGALEVRNHGQLVGMLNPGDVFGEMAFLLEQPRTYDVHAAIESRVLSLSEGSLRRMIAEDPAVAAKLLLNISKMLCSRLIATDPASSW